MKCNGLRCDGIHSDAIDHRQAGWRVFLCIRWFYDLVTVKVLDVQKEKSLLGINV